MADVRWIKIYTDMISNKKIKRIRKLPEGNNIVLIWVFLLAQAGECNKSGALYLTDTLPFRSEDLAIEFDYDVTVINLALITLERFSMIEVFDEIIYIKNWNEYQNIEGMDKIREQTRLRNIKYREKQKLLLLNDAAVTSRDETEVELDLELEKDKEKHTTLSDYKILEDEVLKLHAKGENDLKNDEVLAMHDVIRLGIPIPFIVDTMKQMYKEKLSKQEKVKSFVYYHEAIKERFNKPLTTVKNFKRNDTDWDKIEKQLEEAERGFKTGA